MELLLIDGSEEKSRTEMQCVQKRGSAQRVHSVPVVHCDATNVTHRGVKSTCWHWQSSCLVSRLNCPSSIFSLGLYEQKEGKWTIERTCAGPKQLYFTKSSPVAECWLESSVSVLETTPNKPSTTLCSPPPLPSSHRLVRFFPSTPIVHVYDNSYCIHQWAAIVSKPISMLRALAAQASAKMYAPSNFLD
jgi:hypothetical protein